jgi:hypothetical protein
MSSAILYLAIVAIWACVLIPRWLKRDWAHGAVTSYAETAAPDGFAPAGSGLAADDANRGDDAGDDLAAVLPGDSGDAPRPLPAPLRAPLSLAESRRRMLAARRRLLGMLVLLEAAAIALAFLGLAAMWVIVPPTIMLIGYLLLLREAAQADAEHAKREAEAAARAQEMRSRPGRGARTARHPAPAEGTPLAETIAAAAAADLAAKFAAAPVPADYEDAGRDFAPGLAGKYTTSNADTELTDEDHYGYEQPRLRAVGD